MRVIKRSGQYEEVQFDKITKRIKVLLYDGLDKYIDATIIAQQLCARVYDGIPTKDLDEITSELCMTLSSTHPSYAVLGSRIAIDNHHKNTSEKFSNVMIQLYNNKDIHNQHSPLISQELYNIVCEKGDELDNMIDYSRDFMIDYFGFKTLSKAYLKRVNKVILERPQHMWMRVALGIHGNNIELAKETYDLLSLKYFIHATPTLFHAGTTHQQLSSCFLMGTEDSVEGIYKTITDTAIISKWAGGIGVHISNIRAKGSYIRKTGGYSEGILPMLKVYNNTARYINQSGKRNGSFAMYIEPWHADIFQFLEAKKNHGNEEERARDLFYALWIPDLFMKAVEEDKDWYLMCPDECPNLDDTYGEEFEKLYNKYVKEGKYKKVVKARKDVWEAIISSQIETGMPYMLYKDASNQKSNQKNLGTIKSSNLCVTGDTLILTEYGYFRIDLLQDKILKVWNGYEFSETTIRKTGVDQQIMILEFSNGRQLKCTPYHNFYIQKNGEILKVECRNLKLGDKLIKSNYPVIQETLHKNIEYLDKILQNFSALKVIYGVLHIKINNPIKLIYILNTLGCNPKILHKDTVIISRTEVDILSQYYYNHLFNSIYMYDEHLPTVISIRYQDFNEDTWCFNEPLRHMGIFNGILCGNCSEIIEYSDNKETAVCNLASIALSNYLIYPKQEDIVKLYIPKVLENDIGFTNYKKKESIMLFHQLLKSRNIEYEVVNVENEKEFLKESGMYLLPTLEIVGKYTGTYSMCIRDKIFSPEFDYKKLYQVSKVITKNLNRVIDLNFYPTPETKKSNMKHRPIGIGIQGLADLFIQLHIPFESEDAKILNRNIFETIYYGSLEASHELAKEYGHYESYENSPISQGIFQFDLWKKYNNSEIIHSGMWDWENLRNKIINEGGIRNSLLIAPMPTASTSQILGNNEAFEPYTSNMYIRKTLAGEFTVINKWLMNDLINMGLWNEDIRQKIMYYRGSIQKINNIPKRIKDIYKTVWEIPQKVLIDLASDRGVYIDQSQSLNIFMESPTYTLLTKSHFYGWKKGLKTGSYYIRSKSATKAQSFTIDPKFIEKIKKEEDEGCLMCSG